MLYRIFVSLVILWGIIFVANSNKISAQILRQPTNQNAANPHDTGGAITNFKVISNEKDPKTGKWTKVVEYEKDGFKITETFISPEFPSLGERKPINPDTMNMDSVLVLVEKDQYLLAVLYKRKRIRQYRAVFGPEKNGDKFQEGDRKTPEGKFKIVSVRNHSAWQKFVLLDYPNQVSHERFQLRRNQGLLSPNAKIGHSIGIHGIYAGNNQMVDMGIGWTDGCVSLKTNDIEDFVKFIKPGVRVVIR